MPNRHLAAADPDEWVRQFTAYAEQAGERARELRARLAAAGESVDNQYLQMEVSAGAQLTNLRLKDAAMRLTANQLSTKIVEAYEQAAGRVARRTLDAVADYSGAGSAMSAQVRDAMPANIRQAADEVGDE